MANGKAVNTFGFELIAKTAKPKINNKQDIIVCFVHWLLVRRGAKCVGSDPGYEDCLFDNVGEELPENWNNHKFYSIKYLCSNVVYVLCALKYNDIVLINFAQVGQEPTAGFAVHLNQINQVRGTLNEMIPNLEKMISEVEKEVIDPILPFVTSQDAETQTDRETERRKSGLMVPSDDDFDDVWDMSIDLDTDAANVGHSDLYPLVPGLGGGMLFPGPGFNRPPLPNPRLPRGAVPPGARFDQIYPPIPDLRGGFAFFGGRAPRPVGPRGIPDYDHLPPPGFDDDSFM